MTTYFWEVRSEHFWPGLSGINLAGLELQVSVSV